MKTTTEREQFVQGRAEGKSYTVLSQEIGVSKTTLVGWSKELELDIGNRRAMEQEALFEAHRLTRRHRVDMFAAHLARLQEEIGKRDLSSVPTDKLFTLMVQLMLRVKEEETATIFHNRFYFKDPIEEAQPIEEWQG